MKKHSITRWVILSFAAVLAVSLAVSAGVSCWENWQVVINQVEEEAALCADLVSLKLGETDPDELFSSGDSELYQKTRETLSTYAAYFNVEYLTVYRLDPGTRTRQILICTSNDPDTDQKLLEEMPCGTVSDAPLLPTEEKWLNGDRDAFGFRRDNLKTTWILPYTGADDILIAIDDSAGLENSILLYYIFLDIVPVVLGLLLGLIVLLFMTRRRIIIPIRAISDGMKRFARNTRQQPEPLGIRSGDEIGEIADSFEKMTEDISEYINSIETLTKEQTETSVQLDVARQIQYGLVPENTSLEGSGFRVCAMTHPAKEVGGDFYDCFLRDDSSVCVVMGDVSGKGISAAIFMAMTKTMIREKLSAGLSPAEALNQANDRLCAQNPEGLFATVFIAVLNPLSGDMRYANAGHTYPVILGRTPSILETDPGIVLGLFGDAGLRNFTLHLAPSEGLLLYTDGVTEAVSLKKTFFGTERLLEALTDVSGKTDARQAILSISCAVQAFCEGCEPFDDMALLALYRKTLGDAGQPLPMTLSAFDEVKEAVLSAAGNTPETRQALLACDEALANIVNYSGAKDLTFSCEKEGEELRVLFSDDGIPFDPSAAQTEDREFDLLSSGGMGLNLIRQSVSSIRYERRENRNELTLSFRLTKNSVELY